MEDAYRSLYGREFPSYIRIVEPDEKMSFRYEHGKLSADCGKASMLFIAKAVDMCMNGEADAVVTCPINKKAVQMAGYPYTGHTEYLGHLCGVEDFSMLLVGKNVRTILATTHVPIDKVKDVLSEDRVYNAIRNAHDASKYFTPYSARIAVCGLNPHAGDEGAIGSDEQDYITPAIVRALNDGMNVYGPYPADSLFPKAAKGEYDFVIAMYHDQGMIPVKMEAFGSAVNVTLNLPVIRTSVDHGTAFDIAGKNIAEHSSLSLAVKTAQKMVNNARSSSDI